MKNKAPLILLSVSITVILTTVIVFLLISLFNFNYDSYNLLSDSALVSGETATESALPEDSSKDDTSSDSSQSATSSNPSSSETVAKPVSPSQSSSVPEDNGIRLVMTSPTTNKINTTEAVFTFKGTSDAAKPLLVNGTNINRTANGEFTYTANLKTGDNKFEFSHKGQKYYYPVNYRYVVINY